MFSTLIGWLVIVAALAIVALLLMRTYSRLHQSEAKLSKDVEVDIVGNSGRPSSNDFARLGHRRVASSLKLHERDIRP